MTKNNSDIRNSLSAVRKLIKEAQEPNNVIDLDGKANLHLNNNGIRLDDQQLNQLKDFLKEFVDNVDQRITDFTVNLGVNTATIGTAIEGNSIRVVINLLAGNNVDDQVSFTTTDSIKLSVINKLQALKLFLNPKRTEFLITLVKQ